MLRLILPIALGVALGAPGSASAQADADFELVRDWYADRLEDREHWRHAAPPRWHHPDAARLLRLRAALRVPARRGWSGRRAAAPGPRRTGRAARLRLSRGLGRGDVGPAPPRPAQGRRHADAGGRVTGSLTPSANGRWVACEVRAERETLSVSLDGMVVSVADRADAFSGFVAFEATGTGGLELRGVRIATRGPRGGRHARTASRRAGPASRGPSHARGVAARPTIGALEERVEGTVWLEFVIEADGRLGDLRVVVTPHPDLAARRSPALAPGVSRQP